MCRRRDDILAKSLPWLAAVSGDSVVGYAYAGLYRPRVAYRDTVENSIYMRSDMIGRGLGKQLLAALIAACEARELRQMIAIVGDSANQHSINCMNDAASGPWAFCGRSDLNMESGWIPWCCATASWRRRFRAPVAPMNRRRLGLVLGLNQTMSWGMTFYLPAVIAAPAAPAAREIWPDDLFATRRLFVVAADQRIVRAEWDGGSTCMAAKDRSWRVSWCWPAVLAFCHWHQI